MRSSIWLPRTRRRLRTEVDPPEHLRAFGLPEHPSEPRPRFPVLRADLSAVLHLRPGIRAEWNRPTVRCRKWAGDQLLALPCGGRGDPDRHQRGHERGDAALVR